MAEKIASGAWRESGSAPASEGPAGPRDDAERFRARRDNARWNLVVGTGLLFLGGFHVGLAVGGAVMVLYGAAMTLYWGARYRKAKGDPWDYDPELDGPGGAEAEIFQR